MNRRAISACGLGRRCGTLSPLRVATGELAFDSNYPVRYIATRVNANFPAGRGATTGGDPDAWADSIREVAAFFGRHLMRGPALSAEDLKMPSPAN